MKVTINDPWYIDFETAEHMKGGNLIGPKRGRPRMTETFFYDPKAPQIFMDIIDDEEYGVEIDADEVNVKDLYDWIKDVFK